MRRAPAVLAIGLSLLGASCSKQEDARLLEATSSATSSPPPSPTSFAGTVGIPL